MLQGQIHTSDEQSTSPKHVIKPSDNSKPVTHSSEGTKYLSIISFIPAINFSTELISFRKIFSIGTPLIKGYSTDFSFIIGFSISRLG